MYPSFNTTQYPVLDTGIRVNCFARLYIMWQHAEEVTKRLSSCEDKPGYLQNAEGGW